MPILDAWTNVFEDPGTRTTETKAQKYLITGPGWQGTVPAGLTEYKSPTNLVWIIGRTYCTGTPEEYKAVHEFQDQLKLVPLSSYGKPYTPPIGRVDPNIDMTTAVRDQVNALDAVAYFKLMAELMKNNPHTAADAPILARISRIGIVPGQDFDITQIDSSTRAVFQKVPLLAQRQIVSGLRQTGTEANGWHIMLKTGVYGTGYLDRAVVTMFGANLPEDAVYPASMMDVSGRPYDGGNRTYCISIKATFRRCEDSGR
jgi:hypothetical protein